MTSLNKEIMERKKGLKKLLIFLFAIMLLNAIIFISKMFVHSLDIFYENIFAPILKECLKGNSFIVHKSL